MFSLKIFRLFDAPASYPPPANAPTIRAPSEQNQQTELTWPQVDRRNPTLLMRRSNERREKQYPTFLDTRKIQGRRRSYGRRSSDQDASKPLPSISLKG